MDQYLTLLKTIKEKGNYKPTARTGMPGTISLFGYQFKHNLAEGFPLLTTKKMFWKGVVAELLWFLAGNTNIKYLVDNGVNIWNEDAYQFYLKQFKKDATGNYDITPMSLEQFIGRIKNPYEGESRVESQNYKLGDCGKQYGWLWRNWEGFDKDRFLNSDNLTESELHHGLFYKPIEIDQIEQLIEGLQKNPMSRRHILTAWNPATLEDMALNACHVLVQFNCRPISFEEREQMFFDRGGRWGDGVKDTDRDWKDRTMYVPRYRLDCQLYQRSADVVLGVPFNIASYALLTHIIADICGIIPGEFIHTFGDVHIYENHIEAVEEQLTREPYPLPKLSIDPGFIKHYRLMKDFKLKNGMPIKPEGFDLIDYVCHPAIKAELSTGLIKN